jgi:hypothetical protein
MFVEASAPPSKHSKGFSHRAFECEGDAFARKKNQVNVRSPNPQYSCQNGEGPIPIREGNTSREPIRITRRFDSSGLNLACEGLLLGMRSEGRKEIPLLNSTSRSGPLSVSVS